MQELVTRLASRFKMGSSSDFRIYYDSPLPLQEYFEHIHQHFEVRTSGCIVPACMFAVSYLFDYGSSDTNKYFQHSNNNSNSNTNNNQYICKV